LTHGNPELVFVRAYITSTSLALGGYFASHFQLVYFTPEKEWLVQTDQDKQISIFKSQLRVPT